MGRRDRWRLDQHGPREWIIRIPVRSDGPEWCILWLDSWGQWQYTAGHWTTWRPVAGTDPAEVIRGIEAALKGG